MGRIVIGIDGSEHAQHALAWAATEATLHGHALEVVTTSPPEVLPGGVWSAPRSTHDVMLAIKQVQADALTSVPLDRGLEVIETREIGFPAASLLARAEGADLVVVGSRGFGAVRGALLGSVSRQVATHAPCPVAVIREPAARPLERIVVGVDGSEHARRALRWAHHEARTHGVQLEAVAAQVWSGTAVGAPWMPLAILPEQVPAARERTRQRLEDEVERVTGDDTVVRTVVDGPAAEALLGRAQDAQLLVVGSRGLGGFERLMLGSVSARCLTHSPCPIVIVPGGPT